MLTYLDYDTYFGITTIVVATQNQINGYLSKMVAQFENLVDIKFDTLTTTKTYNIASQEVYIQAWQSTSSIVTANTDYKILKDDNNIIRALQFCSPVSSCDIVTIDGSFGYGDIPTFFKNWVLEECQIWLIAKDLPNYGQVVTAERSLSLSRNLSDNQKISDRKAQTLLQEIPKSIKNLIWKYKFSISNYLLNNTQYGKNNRNCC